MSDDIRFNDLEVTVEIFDAVWNAILSQSDYLEEDSAKLPFIRNKDKIQPKLVAGENIVIDSETDTISVHLQGVNKGIETIDKQRFLSIPFALKFADQIDRQFSVAYKVCAQFRGTYTRNPHYWQACTMFLHPHILFGEYGVAGGFPFLQFDGYRVSFYPGYGSKIDLYDVDGNPTNDVVDIIFPSVVSWHSGVESDWESDQVDSLIEAPLNWANHCALFTLDPLPTTGLVSVDGTMYNSVSLRDAFGLFKGIGESGLNVFLRFTGAVDTEGGKLNPLKAEQTHQLNLNSVGNQTQILWNAGGEYPRYLRVRTVIDGVENVVLVADVDGYMSEGSEASIPISINSSENWWWELFDEYSAISPPDLFLDKWEILF